MFRISNFIILICSVLFFISLFTVCTADAAQSVTGNNKNGLNEKIIISENSTFRPVLAITPREIDAGTIAPGGSASGVFTLKNMGSGIMEWSTSGPESWRMIENEKLVSTVVDDADYLRIAISIPPNDIPVKRIKYKVPFYPTELRLEAGNQKLICQKDLPPGVHREAIKITSAGGLRTIFITFKIVSAPELPQINLNPVRMDMGYVLPGKIISRKIRLTNKGKEMLKWSVVLARQRRDDIPVDNLKKGRYISFVNEEIRGNGVYSPPALLKESLDVTGKWTQAGGYPSSTGGSNTIKFRFSGTGVSIYFTTYPDFGNLTVYLDEQLISEHDWFADQKENSELLVADNLADGPHVLTLLNKEGRLDIEGVKVLGKEVLRGPAGWITVFPVSGSTTLETEYINVTLNTAQLSPGYYGDNILFNSNDGEGTVEVFVEIIADKLTKTIDVFRYSQGLDFLFTANPQAEARKLSQNSYVKEGIAFRLFVPDTPGTTSFYRWYNPQKKDHFYHYDSRGGGKQLQGYVFEGSIGNIATSRLTNTRELYRWFNPSTAHYFFTTDPKGEKVEKKGYRFDGIAGYVK
jgi:hypothetical protein